MFSSMLMPRFDFEAPSSVEAALTLLAGTRGEAALLAGGTDLLVKMKQGAMSPRLVVALGRIPELANISSSRASGAVQLGPMCTMARLAAAPWKAPGLEALAEGAAVVGGPIIRNRATVGGNIVTARPCADSVAPLMALDATLEIRSAQWERTYALDGFISGPGKTEIRPDEVLVGVRVPPRPVGRTGSAYIKIGRRAAMEVTIAGCAASVDLDEEKKVTRARLVYTSVAPVPLRVRAAEEAVEGKWASLNAVNEAAALARRGVTPIDDMRAPGQYRSEVVQVLTRRALTLALERAGWEISS